MNEWNPKVILSKFLILLDRLNINMKNNMHTN